MKKQLISTLLIMAVLVSFTSCSSSKTEESVKDTSESSVTQETSIETTEAEETAVVTETVPTLDLTSLPVFEVTSENLHDGVWDDVISNTSAGENKSPDLSWESVDGANSYVLYMIDISANNWLHMKVSDITTNSLSLGDIDEKHYIGPYPPEGSGDHEYVVYIFAVRETPASVKGGFDNSNTVTDYLFSALDINSTGESGNVIAYGMISGTYMSK